MAKRQISRPPLDMGEIYGLKFHFLYVHYFTYIEFFYEIPHIRKEGHFY
jgi:hypothetical protein